MLTASLARQLELRGRTIGPAVTGDRDLGPFKELPGVWANLPGLPGRGWNMIALPVALPVAVPEAGPGADPSTGSRPGFRLLLNQFNEELKFNLVDKAVPNRGVRGTSPSTVNSDQVVVTLDYEQSISQIAAEDFPDSGLAGGPGLAIHHEPGLFLNMSDPNGEGGPDIARLATIPHGDAALGLGTASTVDGAATIPFINALPMGVDQSPTNPYLAPYRHFHDNPFKGLFDPTDPTALLKDAIQGRTIIRTTVLEFDTTLPAAGIQNIPFIVKQANASEMKATFFIHELAERDEHGGPTFLLQYAQVVQLDFFPRFDGGPGRIKWPHVSINTMAKVADVPDMQYATLPSDDSAGTSQA
ncbi:heme-binding protein [Nakamurella sp.]|uniref:heme-binding protein n=1 Tax=Nakamurella sp. TaxID=1869182 RepID=UPI003B3B972F